MPRQRIMLVDDHEVVRLGLKALIERRPNMEVVGEGPALVAKGKTNHEMAQALNLGEGSVRNGLSNSLGKLGVAKRAEAAAYASQHNLEGLS